MDDIELVAKISELLECSLKTVSKTLGIKLDLDDEARKKNVARAEAAANYDVAVKVFTSTPNNSEAREIAFDRMIDLAEDIHQIIQILDGYWWSYILTPGTKKKIYKRWDEISYKMATEATTLSEIKEVYMNTRAEGQIKKIVHTKWGEIAMIQVNNASGLEDLESIRWNLPEGSEAYKLANEKLEVFYIEKAEEAKTLGAVRELVYTTKCGRGHDLALKKWNKLSAEEVEMAQTLIQLKQAYQRSHFSNKLARNLAIRKIARIMTGEIS